MPSWRTHEDICVRVLGLGRSFCRAVDEIVDYSGEGVMEHDKCVRPPRVPLVGDVEVALDNPWDYLCWYLEKYGLELRSGLAAAVLHCVVDRLYNYLRMGLVCVEVCRSSPEVCLEMALSSVEDELRRWEMKFSMHIGSSSCPYHYTAVIEELRPRIKVSSGFIVEKVLGEIGAKGIEVFPIGGLYLVLIKRAKRMGVSPGLCYVGGEVRPLPLMAALQRLRGLCRSRDDAVVRLRCPNIRVDVDIRCGDLRRGCIDLITRFGDLIG